MNEPNAAGQPIAIYLDNLDAGGTSAYGTELAIRLRARGLGVHVLCNGVRRGLSGPLTAETYLARLDEAGVPVHELGRAHSASIAGRLGRVLEAWRVLRSLGRPAVILLMGYIDGGGPAAMAARLAGARTVVRAELQPPMPPLSAAEVSAARRRDRLVDLVVVGSEENRRMLRELMGRTCRVAVVNSGVDLQAYAPGEGRLEARQELGIADGECVVGVIARLVERKGVADFVDAAGAIASDHPNARFLVVGDGPDRGALEARAGRAAPARFTFTGLRADVTRLLAAMDVFVMPSHFEGGPLVLVEAMAMALPVVSTRVGMAPDLLEHDQQGLLVEPHDVRALAGAVGELLADAGRRDRLGSSARARVASGFTLDAMVDGYLSACTPERASGRSGRVSRTSPDVPIWGAGRPH